MLSFYDFVLCVSSCLVYRCSTFVSNDSMSASTSTVVTNTERTLPPTESKRFSSETSPDHFLSTSSPNTLPVVEFNFACLACPILLREDSSKGSTASGLDPSIPVVTNKMGESGEGGFNNESMPPSQDQLITGSTDRRLTFSQRCLPRRRIPESVGLGTQLQYETALQHFLVRVPFLCCTRCSIQYDDGIHQQK